MQVTVFHLFHFVLNHIRKRSGIPASFFNNNINNDKNKINVDLIKNDENNFISSIINSENQDISKPNYKAMDSLKYNYMNTLNKSINENQVKEKFVNDFKYQLSLGANYFNNKTLKKTNEQKQIQINKDENETKNNSEINKPIEKNKTIHKKKKKQNELEIISFNLKKSSQNLNQPDVFYAGLFSHLISKGGPEHKE